ncbi:glutamine-fructose-6-phosphate transaminase (isomerizing) [Saprolegnia diclina VS20]|uniref:Glutamine--fructose-6-phosphate aminotransferase [isomerizing] n=1 Tax=Saprolegnia diclina (strain VS20) TaxID=1156394 RepID=T0QW47_SAPDV|nr:glutamine-fructose-6-phosphate transaminase (isomerizing) [Saprolegnia diclina VS20]EQC42439.1 glutamine-fructose-6-phosphate transaminase (isomerizing) [Saprolegnia diclina VS20]|eukprot:XP_008603862.1 glutamine-fructose-6-phosphate transaminase (isomerizing) [Saprolegnia diclina VS20]
MLHASRRLLRAPALARTLFAPMAARALPTAAADEHGWAKYGLGAVLLMAGAGLSQADNCGIVGVVSKHQEANSFLLEGLTILQNRGYDSAGMATTKHDGAAPIEVTKFASVQGTADSINLLRQTKDKHEGNTVGIAHTRWATHGGKTDENSHPHMDMNKRVAVVHNGTITNYNEIKNELIAEGVTFTSQTDTEVIAQLIGHLMGEGADSLTATRLALERLEGTWGLCIMARDEPGKVIVARNGSPLCIGYGSNSMYIASETTAFSRHTKRFLSLQDGEVAVVKCDSAELNPQDDNNEGTLQRFPTSRLGTAPDVKVRLSPAPFPHWTIREIIEQPKAVASALGYGGRVSDDHVYLGGLEAEKDKMLKIKHLLISACGTSLNAAKYGAKLMRTLGSFDTVSTEDAAETTNERLPRHEGGILVVSQSGETKDVHRVLQLQHAQDLPMFSVVNAVGSLIARTTRCGVYLNAGRENAVASTKAFVTQVTVLGLIAAWFAQNRVEVNRTKLDELIQSLHRLPITIGMALRTRAICADIADKLMPSEHLFVLGKGYAEPIAYEGALKIKEITYLHAEGYSGGALKHGPFALIEGKEGQFGPTPIILIVLDDEHGQLMKTAAEEVRARGAYTIIITDNPAMCDGLADAVIPIPNNGPMTALLASVPLQLIAYELAVKRGINPDVPRNLAKAVTVD